MKLCWTHQAFGDRDAIMDHIAKDNVPAALAIDERIASAVENLLLFPQMGRTGRVTGTRELVVVKTDYIVAYKLDSKAILILRVLHGAQQWPEDLGGGGQAVAAVQKGRVHSPLGMHRLEGSLYICLSAQKWCIPSGECTLREAPISTCGAHFYTTTNPF
jgi:toxin ParE1/3/4